VKKIFPCFLLSIILIFILSACRNVTPPSQPVPTSVRPDPTSTPTAVALLVHTPAPTSVVSDLVATSNYTHSTHRFSISYPENWQLSERPDGVIFIEPGDHAGYSVFFNDVKQAYSQQKLNQYLVAFVAENFVDEKSNFSVISQEDQADGSVEAQFSTLDPTLGQTINEVRVSQVDTIVFVRFISATEEQWEISQSKLQALVDTFVPLDTTPATETPPTEEPPVWVLIGPTSNQFGFFYPSDWEILEQGKNTVSVAMPDSEMIFEASVFAWPDASDDPEAAEKAALAYLTSISKKYKAVEELPPTEFPLDTVTGTTIDFLYTTEEDVAMAGSVITAANEDQIYRVVFTSPAEFYGAALQWFNPMYQSFKILPADEMIQE
jgi:hypothetical protein